MIASSARARNFNSVAPQLFLPARRGSQRVLPACWAPSLASLLPPLTVPFLYPPFQSLASWPCLLAARDAVTLMQLLHLELCREGEGGVEHGPVERYKLAGFNLGSDPRRMKNEKRQARDGSGTQYADNKWAPETRLGSTQGHDLLAPIRAGWKRSSAQNNCVYTRGKFWRHENDGGVIKKELRIEILVVYEPIWVPEEASRRLHM